MGKKLDEEPCPKCKKPVSVSASRCPYCQTDYSKEEMAARSTQNKQGIAVGCGVLIALVLLLAMCTANNAPSDETEIAAETPSTVASPKDQELQFTGLYRLVIETGKDCDKANTSAVEALGQVGSGKANVYAAFPIVDNAEKTCREAVDRYGSISVPTVFPQSMQTSLRESIAKCKAGYEARVFGLGTVKEVMDGDARPSLVQSFQENQQLAQAGVMLCAAGLADVGIKLGLSPDEIAAAAK